MPGCLGECRSIDTARCDRRPSQTRAKTKTKKPRAGCCFVSSIYDLPLKVPRRRARAGSLRGSLRKDAALPQLQLPPRAPTLVLLHEVRVARHRGAHRMHHACIACIAPVAKIIVNQKVKRRRSLYLLPNVRDRQARRFPCWCMTAVCTTKSVPISSGLFVRPSCAVVWRGVFCVGVFRGNRKMFVRDKMYDGGGFHVDGGPDVCMCGSCGFRVRCKGRGVQQ